MPPPVPQRIAAQTAGNQTYSTGKPCRNGHFCERYTSNGLCIQCVKKNVKKWEEKRPWHPNRLVSKRTGGLVYSTGTKCPHGHDERLVSNGQCRACSIRKQETWNCHNPNYDHAGAARKRRAKDPTGHRAEVRRWARKHPEKIRELYGAWREANREWVREYGALYARNRRAKIIENGGLHTREDIAALYLFQAGRCRVCQDNPLSLEVDHIVPIIRGGSGDPSNLQLLCLPCNRSKGSRDFEEWLMDRHDGQSVLDRLFNEAVT